MKQHKGRRFKQGAASFYMVAIATLVLVVIATSFAAIMIAEISRTSNDDLSQSAYDAAVAGVEDARLAYYNYKNCIKNDGDNCERDYLGISDGSSECNSFADKIGRVKDETEVKVQEGSGNDMDQAYTCAKIDLGSYDYLSSLNDEYPTRVVKVKLADEKPASDVKAVKMSWGVNGETVENVEDLPTLEVGLLQTGGDTFTMDSFDITKGETTNRGTVFLEPTSGDDGIVKIGVDDGDPNGFLKSNDKTVENTPYQVQCNGESEPQCSVVIALPEPVDGHRNDDTFMLMWSKIGRAGLYQNIDVKMELCYNAENCTTASEESGSEGGRMRLDMQVVIDSTGRANDLYRRVEVRLEKEDTGSQKIYALMARDIMKDIATCEENFKSVNSDSVPNCQHGEEIVGGNG